ncbi:MAG: DUF58 domain-containing protein [Planctomycetes bacterium]|nr:DUF58 domain-containing protein [Planctomycetota bacterium]
MSGEAELFDPKFLSRLRALFFKLRKRRQLRKKGLQATPAAGFTREFKDHRHYTAGDDYRAIDWRLFARHERLFIRIFEEVQEFHIHILLDRSRSMYEPHAEKRSTALRLAVALAYLGLIGQHRVSLLTLGPDARREMPPLKGQGHVHALLQCLTALEFDSVTDLVASLRQFRPGRDRRGIVFIISDLFGRLPEESWDALSRTIAWPAETHVIHVLHPHEMQPNLEGETQLIEVETAESRRIWLTRRELEAYARAFGDYRDALERSCMRRQINYVAWATDQPFEEMFLGLLARGSALAGG